MAIYAQSPAGANLVAPLAVGVRPTRRRRGHVGLLGLGLVIADQSGGASPDAAGDEKEHL